MSLLGTSFLSGIGSGLGMTLVQALVSALARPTDGAPEIENDNPNLIHGDLMSYDILGGSIGYNDPDALLHGLLGENVLVGGDGSSEIIGALASAAQNGNQSAQRLIQQIASRNAGAVVQRELDRKRRYPLGVVPTSIAAGVQSQIPASPQNLFRPERLVVPSDLAFDTGIVDIKVGNVSQFVQSAEVPGALFSEVAINTGVNFDTAEIGNQISVLARNKSGSSIEFSAGFVGTIAK